MHKHTILAPAPGYLLSKYIEERRREIAKAQTYVSKKETEKVKKWFLDATILCLIILAGLFVYLHW